MGVFCDLATPLAPMRFVLGMPRREAQEAMIYGLTFFALCAYVKLITADLPGMMVRSDYFDAGVAQW